MKRVSPITVANDKVPIATACRMFGVAVPDDDAAGRRKVHCPFGAIYHSDHGRDPAMRIYPESNHAYCFSCSTAWTPVSLAAKATGTTWNQAAQHLLDRIGYRPLDLAGRWQKAVEHRPPVDRSLLAEALKTYCRRTAAGWSDQQFEPQVARQLSKCLRLLDLVRTDDAVPVWLEGSKRAMDQVLSG